MRETLRLAPTAPMRSVSSLEDTTLKNGTYVVQKGQLIATNLYTIHRDPAVWGENVSDWDTDYVCPIP